MTTVERRAPAKVNLTLHVTGKRADGYHLLDSLVTFAEVGDRLICRKSDSLSLTIAGPFARGLEGEGNLVLKAAELLGVTADITLEKHLPVAAGIGGGSADAAAALHALTDLYNMPLPPPEAQLTLGADVPACVQGGYLRMRGIGEDIEVLDTHPLTIPMVLVNPGVSVPTAKVFGKLNLNKALTISADIIPPYDDAFIDWLAEQRNDLEAPALDLAPVIGDVLAALRSTEGVGLARMSGSGATCFALYPDERDAAKAVDDLKARFPKWWVSLAVR